jgi:hypothetical protein
VAPQGATATIRSRRRRTAGAAHALAAALLLAACGTETMTFAVLLPTVTADYSNPTDCAGTGEWADIHSGAEVIVTDAAGATLRTTSLPRGLVPEVFLPGDAKSCRFEVHVGWLPRRSSYALKIGKHEMSIDFADAVQSQFTWMVP